MLASLRVTNADVEDQETAKEKSEEKKSPEEISIESAIDQEPISPAAAITELGNVQTPASIWLPYKDATANRNRVGYIHSTNSHKQLAVAENGLLTVALWNGNACSHA